MCVGWNRVSCLGSEIIFSRGSGNLTTKSNLPPGMGDERYMSDVCGVYTPTILHYLIDGDSVEMAK